MSTAKIIKLPISVSPQKWEGTFCLYDEEKKYGYIKVKGTNSSVEVHENTLLLEGVKFVQDQQVRFSTFNLGGGRRGAVNIEVLGPQTKCTTDKEVFGEWYNGNLKWYDPNRGFGLVTLERTGKDVFLHASVLKKTGFNTSKRTQNKRVCVQVDFVCTDPPQVVVIQFV